MRLLKSHSLLRLVNSYVVDSPQPSNINYLWNFGSLLATCLVIQILSGCFLAMHVRCLVCNEPANLIALTEFISSKTIALADFEMNKQVEHGNKVLTDSSYNYNKGELIFFYDSLIHLSRDARPNLKITDTSLLSKLMKNAYISLNSLNMKLTICLRMESKVEITDSLQETQDLLRKVISNLVQETKSLIIPIFSVGDGEIIVSNQNKIREGFQDSIIIKDRTRTLIHSKPILKAVVKGYYLRPVNSRNISSKSFNKIDTFISAYKNMKLITNNSENLDGISFNFNNIKNLQSEIQDWTYECKPNKIFFNKVNYKIRQIGIPNTKDKLLQYLIKELIEPKCEEIFHPMSFGFRPNRSLHHALIEVQRMRDINWIIEGEIKGYFDIIDQKILVNQIKEKLNPDRTIMTLINKIIKAGYLQGNKYSILGNPQGGILSPILSNLYLTPLDEYIDSLKERYKKLTISKRNSEYNKIEVIKNIQNENIKDIKEIINLPSNIKVTIYYVRYGEQWLIGIKGNHELAIKIKEEVNIFLINILKLQISKDKIKLIHLRSEYAKFLDHYIKIIKLSNNNKPTPQILAPKDLIKNKLIEYGFADKKGFPKYLGKFIHLSDYEIVQQFNNILREFMNFYNMSENRYDLNELVYILEYSLAHTLAAKHRLSLKKVFKKYSKILKVTVESDTNTKSINFDKPTSLKAEYLNKKYTRISRYQK